MSITLQDELKKIRAVLISLANDHERIVLDKNGLLTNIGRPIASCVQEIDQKIRYLERGEKDFE